MSDPLREKLRSELSEASWRLLLEHHVRGGLVWVHPELDIVEVAASIAEDQAAILKAWMNAGLVGTATDDQVRDWAERGQVFRFLIVQPFVVASPLQLAAAEA
ncbi:MAG: DUF2288 domain-containing protein [Alphaproteobacteria bacterium]|nr:DUF2288 domain-containing protein [Alphaproteobacteria bacterium]